MKHPETERIRELEDAITEAGILLAGAIDSLQSDSPFPRSEALEFIQSAMRTLGQKMNDPEVLKRQGI